MPTPTESVCGRFALRHAHPYIIDMRAVRTKHQIVNVSAPVTGAQSGTGSNVRCNDFLCDFSASKAITSYKEIYPA